MTDATDNLEAEADPENPVSVNGEPEGPPVWLRASLADLVDLDFETPIIGSQSADSNELGQQFRAAIENIAGEESPATPAARVFSMLTAVMGMFLKAQETNEPFGPMVAWADGRRSATPADFRGEPAEALAAMAERAKHPVLRARLADVCWLLDRKRVSLGMLAISAYVEIVKQVDDGALKFQFDKDQGALKFEARDLLRRALSIARGRGLDPSSATPVREFVAELRRRSFDKRIAVPALWFGHLDLDFNVSDPGEVGKDVETLASNLTETDGHTIVNLWRMASRAFHLAKKDSDQHRSQSEAAEQLARMAGQQPLAMLGASMLAEAIAELHGVPGKKDRRKELRHRLVDVQAGIADEMSPFSIPMDLTEIARLAQQHVGQHLSLRDKLFVFAALERSPDPAALAEAAASSIREHPFSSLFNATHHDSEGKIIHRSDGAGFGDGKSGSAIEQKIAQAERVRRHIVAAGKIEATRQVIATDHYLSDDAFVNLLLYSAFVPRDTVATYSRGFLRFFQGDFTSGLYILAPLLENSLRHVLKNHGHDVTNFDDAKKTQQDRTISALFDQMRRELDSIFGAAITTDIENVFLKKSGPYLRHSLAHGLLPDGAPYGVDAIYGCWLIFHLCMLPLFPIRTQLMLPFDDAAQDQAAAPPDPASGD
ncbi:MAG: hypothetical protein ABI192_20590 [Bradyrhizobium sp.]